MKKSAHVLHKGFTLVELLVVIAIIAVLAAVVVLIINPIELTRRGRDAARLTDLANLQNAINVAVQEGASAGSTTAALLCAGTTAPCRGESVAGGRVTDGSGWVKVNVSTQKSVSVATLPVDPINTAADHYVYCSDGNGYEIATHLESTQMASKAANDGGADATAYEVGSSLSLLGGADCAY